MPGISTSPSHSASKPQHTSPSSSSKKPTNNSIINEIALDSLKELAVSLTMTGVTCFFVATPAIPSLVLFAIGTAALNTLVRASIIWFKQGEIFSKLTPESQKQELVLLGCIAPYIYTVLDVMTRQVLVHEAGHALAANAVYKYANPSIEIFPFSNNAGVTRFSPGALTKIGSYLGQKNSRLFVTMAGPMAGIFLALVDLGIAHKVRDSHPQLHRYLVCTAICNVANHALYAISALFSPNEQGHDFAMLWKVGNIHPIVSVICIIAVPVIFQAGLLLSEHLLK